MHHTGFCTDYILSNETTHNLIFGENKENILSDRTDNEFVFKPRDVLPNRLTCLIQPHRYDFRRVSALSRVIYVTDEGDMKSTATAEEGMTTTIAAVDDGADDRAATTIQAVYRGFRARKYVETVTAAAVKIQAGFRGYRVRQSLKNAAPPSSTATTTTTADNSQCWSDDDQKSVVSVTYAPLNEEPAAVATATVAVIDDDEVFAYDGDKAECTNDDDGKECTDGGRPPEQQTTAGAAVAAADDEDDVRALTDAAVKIQARVRGFAVRKHLNEEKKKADKE